MASGSHLADLNRSREKNILGMKFGKLTVIEKDGRRNNRHTFSCICECGKKRGKVIGGDLVRGKTKSCGCDFPVSSKGSNLTLEQYLEHSRKRILDKIKIINDCWEWQGQLNNHGYAFASWGQKGNKKKTVMHRVSYILWKGEIPEGLCALHKCDNPKCINPDHIFLGTMKENTQDMLKKGRGRKKNVF